MMTPNAQTIEATVLKAIADVTGQTGLTRDAKFADFDFDSLDRIELLMAVEEVLRVDLPDAAPGKEHHDLSEIAKRYGGGGHRGACGFRTSKLPLAPVA